MFIIHINHQAHQPPIVFYATFTARDKNKFAGESILSKVVNFNAVVSEIVLK